MSSLEFAVQHKYNGKISGITVPVELRYGTKQVRLEAKIDTGAEFCLFERGYGEMLGIGIQDGNRQELRTVNGTFVAYGHEVSLTVLGRTLLGRQGWLPRVRLGLIDYEQLLFLSQYSV